MLDIEKMFAFHGGTPETIPLHTQVRAQLKVTAQMLAGITPKCAEQTIAIRKLQEAMFYFNAAIALNPPVARVESDNTKQ